MNYDYAAKGIDSNRKPGKSAEFKINTDKEDELLRRF